MPAASFLVEYTHLQKPSESFSFFILFAWYNDAIKQGCKAWEGATMRGLKGFEKVDAYLIPKKEAGPYKRQRKQARKLAIQAMESFCYRAHASFKGSQDGEAVVGLDKKGDLVALIHLDPDGVAAILKAHEEGNLAAMLKKQ